MILKKIEKYFHSCHLPAPASIVVACSGGPDSLCLLHSLSQLQNTLSLTLHVGYIDHGMRAFDERERERRCVEQNAVLLGLPLVMKAVEPGLIAQRASDGKKSLEETAREFRYQELEKIREESGAEYIAFAHHADDQAETMLMRFFQGSGLTGLRGIPKKRGRIIRPLFECTRDEILAFCGEHNISYVIDSTNENQEFLRNKIRHRIMPAVMRDFPGLRTSLANLRQKIKLVDGFLSAYAKKHLKWKKTGKGLSIQAKVFIKAPAAIRIESFLSAYSRLRKQSRRQEGNGDLPKQLPFKFLTPLYKRTLTSGSRTLLSGMGMVFFRQQDRLFLETSVVAEMKKGYVITISPDMPFSLPHCSGVLARVKCGSAGATGTVFAEKDLSFPLVLRSWKPGDRIDLGFGRKKLKKLYQEWGVHPDQRLRIPVLEDSRGILAVAGGPFGFSTIVRKGASPNKTQDSDILFLDLHPER